jgi:hypothetical protein
MGPGIIIPVVILAIVLPLGFTWAKRLKEGALAADTGEVVPPASKLTSKAFRELPTPPWRIVYEIGDTKLGGVEHVLIGPPGVFAVQTTIDPLPAAPIEAPDAQAIARAAIVRGELDDALARAGMSSDRLVRVHWGPPTEGPTAVEQLPGVTAVDGRAIDAWVASLPETLSAAQIDLAWQTVTTAIGRPDPLA